jgi:hypothetical protein
VADGLPVEVNMGRLRESGPVEGENRSVNREEEQIVETTKLSLAHEITKLPLPHKQWYKGVYRKGVYMNLFP